MLPEQNITRVDEIENDEINLYTDMPPSQWKEWLESLPSCHTDGHHGKSTE